MKNLLKNIISLVILGIMFFIFKGYITKGYQQILERVFPCRYPISYSLGSIDKKFDISEEDFLQSVKDAEGIWEGVIGKDLFVYKVSGGDLKIDLKYDNRQYVTNKMDDIDNTVNDKKSSYDNLKSQYDLLKAEIESTKNNLKNQNDVQILNQKINKLNQLAVELDQSAQSINSQVSEYNNIGDSLGGEFEEGLYYSNKDGRGIDIYQFKDKTNLTRLLAHEFGHALSLEHSTDEGDIMYYLNSNDSLTPSINDINALKMHCGIK